MHNNCSEVHHEQYIGNNQGQRNSFCDKKCVVPFIEAEDCRDKNIHASKIMNTKWVPANNVLRKLKVLETTRMTANCFLKHGIPFQFIGFNTIVWQPQRYEAFRDFIFSRWNKDGINT